MVNDEVKTNKTLDLLQKVCILHGYENFFICLSSYPEKHNFLSGCNTLDEDQMFSLITEILIKEFPNIKEKVIQTLLKEVKTDKINEVLEEEGLIKSANF